MARNTIPTLVEEEKLWRYNRILIGVDEAGRGPLAGPVTAAAVTLLPKFNPDVSGQNSKFRSSAPLNDFKDLLTLGVNDSKRIAPKKREKIYEALMSHPSVLWAVGEASEQEIDELNVLRASLLAMKRAVEKLLNQTNILTSDVNIIYIDGREVVPDLIADQKAIIGGDGKIFSIAAASIIAKVTRDRLMLEYAKQYPQYYFEKHKGYGTKLHFEMIEKHGSSPVHRQSFL